MGGFFNARRDADGDLAMHGGRDRQENIIHGVFAEINTRVSYSVAAAESFASAKAALVGSTRDGFPIENFEFVKAGTGVCRHMALATGALLEMAADLGLLKGAAAYHRSHVVANDNPTGHAWTRFTDQAGNRWVLDVANRYCGLIRTLPDLHGTTTWMVRHGTQFPVNTSCLAIDPMAESAWGYRFGLAIAFSILLASIR